MGMCFTCFFKSPEEILNPVITGHKIVIISEQNKGEEIDTLKDVFNQNDVLEDDIVVHTIEEDCNKSNVKAHLEERTGVEELPYITLDGENLGPYSQVIAMSETGDLYKTIHGVDGAKSNVKPERKTSLVNRWFGGGGDKKQKRKSSPPSNPPSTVQEEDNKSGASKGSK